MGDFKISRKNLDKSITDLVRKADRKTSATWALDCAEHVLPYFENEYPDDDRPRLAIEAGRTWVKTNVFKMADIRRAALAAHAAARDVKEDDAPRAAARAAGQAVGTAHVATHAVGAALYALKAVHDGNDSHDDAVAKEREWQYSRLLSLLS
ncbi:MAG: putative immunity protein [Chloroflexota bacterium]